MYKNIAFRSIKIGRRMAKNVDLIGFGGFAVGLSSIYTECLPHFGLPRTLLSRFFMLAQRRLWWMQTIQ